MAYSGHVQQTLGQTGGPRQMEMLQLQKLMQRRSRMLQTLTNVVKARHDAATNTIRNLRP